MATFAAIDFETATSNRNSACAIGISIVDDSKVTFERAWLICPPNNKYHDFNISIHGIRPSDTATSPNFREVWDVVAEQIEQDRGLTRWQRTHR